MTQDDRMETITDPEQIRAVWEAGDMGEESLGGDSESGTYNRSNRPPAGPRPDADNPWALLPDDHPERAKQCGGCGTKWVDAETARACERRHGDDITTPAAVGAGLDLDAGGRFATNAMAQARAAGVLVEHSGAGVSGGTVMRGDAEITRLRSVLVEEIARAESAEAEVRRLTEEAATQREWFEAADAAAERRLDQSIAWMERAEAAEAEVVTLRARLAEGRRIVGMLAETVESECENERDICHEHDRTSDGSCALLADLLRARAALAVTTGEGQ